MKAVRSLLLASLGGALVISLAGFSPGAVASVRAARDAVPEQAAASQTWLERINQIRTASGLAPVTENPAWTDGIRKHLTYLENTPPELMTGPYANAHSENPASPYYTPEGALEASRSNLGGGLTDVHAINGWLVAPFHAIGILRRGLTQVAFARSANGTAGLDIIGGLTPEPPPAAPVLFPGPGSTIDLARFDVNENPDPRETCAITKGIATWSGLPLIAMLQSTPDPAITATLTKPDGTVVGADGGDLCLVDEHHFQTTDTVYGPTGQSMLESQHAVLLLPRAALVAGTYTATIRQPGQPDLTWSFVSAPQGKTPDVTADAKRCSFTGEPSGQLLVKITNPNDGAGPATYTIEGAGTPVTTVPVADGQTIKVVLDGLPAGEVTFTLVGSDGSLGLGGAEVGACPAYQGVTARLGKRDRDKHRVKVVLRNAKNATAVKFTVRASGRAPKKITVAPGGSRRVWAKLRTTKRTAVVVLVAGHIILTKKIRPDLTAR